MKKIPGHGYVRITGPAAGRPADRLYPDYSPTIPKLYPPFFFGKAIIGRFSNEESASEGAEGGHVGENGWVSLSKGIFQTKFLAGDFD